MWNWLEKKFGPSKEERLETIARGEIVRGIEPAAEQLIELFGATREEILKAVDRSGQFKKTRHFLVRFLSQLEV